MKSRFLFPHSWKKWGWILSAIFFAIGFAYSILPVHYEIPWLVATVYQHQMFGPDGSRWAWSRVNLTATIAGAGLIAGLMLVAFSKVKTEDEFTSRIRLDSLQWAVYINYGLLLLAFLLLYGDPFLSVLLYNLFTILVIFIIRFHWILYRQKRLLQDEK